MENEPMIPLASAPIRRGLLSALSHGLHHELILGRLDIWAPSGRRENKTYNLISPLVAPVDVFSSGFGIGLPPSKHGESPW